MNAATTNVVSKGVKWIGFGWTAFILENLILSENREYIISKFGDDKYHMLYNALSTMACGSIFYGYLRHGRGQGFQLKPKTPISIFGGFLVQSIGLVMLSQQFPALQSPFAMQQVPSASVPTSTNLPAAPTERKLYIRCPMDFKAKNKNGDENYGMERISRHSSLWAFGFVSLGEAVTRVFVPEIVMFGFPFVFSIIGSIHQDHRYRNRSGGVLSPEKEQTTSNIPFIALLSGKQDWRLVADEMKWTNAGVSIAACMLWALRKLK